MINYGTLFMHGRGRWALLSQNSCERLRESGEIYAGTYEGWYCGQDETFWLESKLVDGRCPT